MMKRLLDYETLAKLEAAAPHVMEVPLEQVEHALSGLSKYSRANAALHDDENRPYWQCSLKELFALGYKDQEPGKGDLRRLGTAVRSMGLTVWRMNNGWHLAWSEEQLKILRGRFVFKPALKQA